MYIYIPPPEPGQDMVMYTISVVLGVLAGFGAATVVFFYIIAPIMEKIMNRRDK